MRVFWGSLLAFSVASAFPKKIGTNRIHLSSHNNAPLLMARSNRIASLLDWCSTTTINIESSKLIQLQENTASGLGWFATNKLTAGSVLLRVPSRVALTVDVTAKDTTPWFVQFAVLLHAFKTSNTNMQPWLDALPRQLDTPIHWSTTAIQELQYDGFIQAVVRQDNAWKQYYNQHCSGTNNNTTMTYEQFLWGCECARSRAFSGSTAAFRPQIYAFTLFLVTVYVGLNLGTLEQAANGAGVVLCFSILQDFVLPKLLKQKRFVICPMMDMVNHCSNDDVACQVSFEYFTNTYTLAVQANAQVAAGEQIFISYGARSNDQLLQYYGFVEADNPNDVYIMPPLGSWDIEALEQACGRKFMEGRLGKLERAQLLGGNIVAPNKDEYYSTSATAVEAANQGGGVVLTRLGLDPAVLQALRALVSTDQEWINAGEAVGNFCETVNPENEKCAKLAALKAIQMELAAMPTTLEEDQEILRRMGKVKSVDSSRECELAVRFRIEKKKVLLDAMTSLGLKESSFLAA
jgi:hypothetical protein